MKKKNKKLLNFWNKIKKPLMILSVVGNILFILFIILGTIGVKKNKTQMVSADSMDLIQTWNLEDSINFDSLDSHGYAWRIDFYNESIDYYYILEIGPEYSTYRQISYVIEGDEDDTFVVVYDSRTGWTSSVNQTITITAFYSGQYSNDILLEFLNNNSSSESTDTDDLFYLNFQFNKQINYNAPFNASIDSPFFSYQWSDSQWATSIHYDLPYFLSNGEVFNRIEIWIFKGASTGYLDSTNIYRVNDNQDTGYYNYMNYQNTTTNKSVMVNYRNYVVSNASSSVQNMLAFGSEWKNENYRSLNFSSDLTPQEMTNLSQFNNQNFGSNGFTNVSEDVGLSNVFTLISNSFGAFTNIFRIELLPNITIGLLLFLPLIVGIIIFVIWLIKR